MAESETKTDKRIAALPGMALTLMLACILLPAMSNSMHFSYHASPSQLLLAICISLFASVIYLWILDATNVLKFRSEWVSKSIYGAAIASVIGTSVGVYKDYFQQDKYPLRGKWQIVLTLPSKHSIIATNEINLSFSENSKTYYGYSNINKDALKDSSTAIAVEIQNLDLNKESILFSAFYSNGSLEIFSDSIGINDARTTITLSSKRMPYELTLSRPNY